MKISINLASQPFRRDRAMIVASLAVCVLLVVSLGLLSHLAIQDNTQMGDVRREVASLKKQVQDVSAQQAKLDAVIRQPQNETVLEQAAFINALLLRKGISWNQIFHDLEKTLPYNVKLITIRPTVDDQGRVTLAAILASENGSGAYDALSAFQANPTFGFVQLNEITPPTQTEPLFRVTISVTYAQKL
jgi:Tfp pilus assembly protein PilN